MEIIAITNQKGGVGKTTTTINLSASLAKMGKNVLIIDMDPQANATQGMAIEKYKYSLYDCLTQEIPLNEVIVRTNYENISIVPSNIILANAELELSTLIGREQVLKECINTSNLNEYDYIFIDCNPSLGLLTVNALAVANSVIIPMEPAIFAFQSIEQLLKVINLIKRKINSSLKIKGVLITRADRRTNIEKEFLDQIQKIFADKVFRTVIHQTVKISQAQIEGKSIIDFAPESIGAKEYIELAKELIERDERKFE